MKNIISAKHIALIALGLMVGLGATYAMAWTAPTAAPTGGNVAAPVNTGAAFQIKTGSLQTQSNLGAAGTIVAGNKITAVGSGVNGTITGRILRATNNICIPLPGVTCPPPGENTAFMAAQKFCLTNNPASGVPGDAGYNCVSPSTGWGGLTDGTQLGNYLTWTGTADRGWWESTSLREGFIPGGNGFGLAVGWGSGAISTTGSPAAMSPAAGATQLDVNGKVRIRGGFTAVPQNATSKVLTTKNATGDATWQSLGSQVVTVFGDSNTIYSDTSRRVFATCPLNYKVIGGGGICQGGTLEAGNQRHAFSDGMFSSYPVSRSDATVSNNPYYGNNNVLVPTSATCGGNCDVWMVTCYIKDLQRAWAICVPNS